MRYKDLIELANKLELDCIFVRKDVSKDRVPQYSLLDYQRTLSEANRLIHLLNEGINRCLETSKEGVEPDDRTSTLF